MLVLGIESSCDDMAASVVDDNGVVLSSVVSSQDDIHSLYGGIVPELASRRHIETMVPVIEEALKRAEVTIDDIGAMAVTRGPGLVGSILIGLSFVKAVSFARGIPFVGVNHLDAHALSAFLKDDAVADVPEFPFVSLVVSGGHTMLSLVEDYDSFKLLGQTRDDAAGEAFDKVAKLLGLGYPGGKPIDDLAKRGDATYIHYKRATIKKYNLEFSFSGLKTGVLNTVKSFKEDELTEKVKADISASFQESVVDVLVKKSMWALSNTDCDTLVVAGGVACNSRLRAKLKDATDKEGVKLFMPKPAYCSDNGAMIALLGLRLFEKGLNVGSFETNALPNSDEF